MNIYDGRRGANSDPYHPLFPCLLVFAPTRPLSFHPDGYDVDLV